VTDIVKHLLNEYLPILIAFAIGLILGLRGCSDNLEPEVITIEKPIYKTEYVDRWRTDTVRYVSRQISQSFDTIVSERIVMRLDTLLLIDTLRIVETWLSEKLNYDTVIQFKTNSVTLSWSNYQNVSENLKVSLSPAKNRLRIGLYARAGVISDFRSSTSPVIGGGVQLIHKRFIFGVDYGYSINHQISGIIGYQL
jgi:hypothetical protein